MAPRRLLGCLPAAALAVCAWTACKDKADVAKTQASPAELEARCTLLGKLCGEKDKHIDKIIAECKQVAKEQVEKGCTAKAIAVYDCYVEALCGGADKVWSFADLHVLADRHGKCAAEQAASRECVEKK